VTEMQLPAGVLAKLSDEFLEDVYSIPDGDRIKLCHINLDAYQTNVNRMFGTDFSVPILYFTQLVGVALGLSRQELALGKEIVSAEKLLSSYLDTGHVLEAKNER
jgi:hypothetical protein